MNTLASLFAREPTQFYPLGAGLLPEERGQRLARLLMYASVAQAFRRRDARILLVGGCLACTVMHFYGRPQTIDPATAGTPADPDPTGNAPLGDVSGRHAPPRIGQNLTPAMLFSRMQNPTDGYLDRAIAPQLAPIDSNYVGGLEPTQLGINKWTEFAGGPPHGSMGVAPRGGALVVPPR